MLQITKLMHFQENTSLKTIDLAWNGFGYDGCVALSEALDKNNVLEVLDVSSNRISSSALMELLTGLSNNKALKVLKVRLLHLCNFRT